MSNIIPNSCTITDSTDHGIDDLLLFTNPKLQGFSASAHDVTRCEIGRWKKLSTGQKCQVRSIHIVTKSGTIINFSMFRDVPTTD